MCVWLDTNYRDHTSALAIKGVEARVCMALACGRRGSECFAVGVSIMQTRTPRPHRGRETETSSTCVH